MDMVDGLGDCGVYCGFRIEMTDNRGLERGVLI